MKELYPGKFETDHERQLKAKEWVPKREKPMPYDNTQVRHRKVNPKRVK